MADFEMVNKLGQGKVDLTIGSALDIFGGSLPYQEVCAWHNKHNQQDEVQNEAVAHPAEGTQVGEAEERVTKVARVD